MKVLCLNTAFSETYVTTKNNEMLARKVMDSSLKQSENVLGAVDECLNNSNLKIQDLDVISCVIGPGSFTGIRIGASLVKGFCMAYNNIKKVAINSLDLLAYIFVHNINPERDFYVALNGLSGNVFICKYDKDASPITKPYMATGDDLNLQDEIVVGLLEENFDICNMYVNFDAESLLNYTLEQIEKNNYVDDFVPLYLRKSQAEAELDKKNANS